VGYRAAYIADLHGRKAEATREAYERGIEMFEVWLAAHGQNVTRLSPYHLNAFVGHLAREGYATASLKTYASAVRGYLRFVRRYGVQAPEQETPDFPREREYIPDTYSRAELQQIIWRAHFEPEPYRTALLIAPMCGLRVSELVSRELREAKTDLIDGRPRVTFVVARGKSKTDHHVPLLAQGHIEFGKYLYATRPRLPDGPWLFPQMRKGSRHIRKQDLQTRLRDIGKAIGRTVTIHGFRHTYATALADSGVDIATIMAILGHTDARTTMRYIHLSRARLHRDVATVRY
jgi:integrase/recombinase XerD